MAHVQKRTHKAADGKRSTYWRARYLGPDNKEYSKSFSRRIDAERFLVTVEADKVRGDWVDPRLGRVTLSEWAERWMATAVHLKPKTRLGYQSLLRTWILPTFGSVPLANVEQMVIRHWVADMTGKGLSPSRIRQAYRLLSAMLGAAVESGYLSRTPCSGVKLPRLPKTDIEILTAQQVNDFATEMGRYSTFVYLLAYGGLRWGEAIALRRKRCEFLRSRIEVAESAADINGHIIFGATKTHERRHVRLPAFLMEMLARQLESLPADSEALVFTAARGGSMRYPNFRRGSWDPAVKRAGLPPSVTPHSLRHTCASLLIAQGADPVAIQKHLGHRDVSTTLNLYGHLFPDRMEQLTGALDEVFENAKSDRQPTTQYAGGLE
jgi:integrase